MNSQEFLNTRKRLHYSMSSRSGSTASQKKRNAGFSARSISNAGGGKYPSSPPTDMTELLKEARGTALLPVNQSSQLNACDAQKKRSRRSQLRYLEEQ
jgi:hypothetical protein